MRKLKGILPKRERGSSRSQSKGREADKAPKGLIQSNNQVDHTSSALSPLLPNAGASTSRSQAWDNGRPSSFIGSAPPGNDELDKARRGLSDAVEELDQTSKKLRQPPNDFMPQVKIYLERKNLRAPDISAALRNAPDQSFQTTVRVLQQHQEARDKTIPGQVAAFLRKLYPVTKLAVGVTKDVSGAVSQPAVTIAATALEQILDLLMKPHTQTEAVSSGLDSLSGDTRLVRRLQDLPDFTADVSLILAAIGLQTALTNFLHQSLEWLARGSWSKAASGLTGDGPIGEARGSLDSARKSMMDAMSIEAHIITIRKEVKEQQSELLSNVCPNDYHGFHLDRQGYLHSKRLPNTGEWFLSKIDFMAWRTGEVAVLWCSGLAGAGKTYVASAIIDDLEGFSRDRDVGLAYVFYERGRSAQQNEETTLAALTRQLLARKPGLCSEFKQQLENKYPTISERQHLLQSVLGHFDAAFIVLDALDEFSADHDHQLHLITTMLSIYQDTVMARLKLCITSRGAYDIWEAIERQLRKSRREARSVQMRADRDDIERLVKKGLDDSVTFQKRLGSDPSLEGAVIESIVERSDCIFKLADLQVKAVVEVCKDGSEAVRTLSGHLSRKIPDYYSDAIARITDRGTDEKVRAFRLLSWLVHSKVPLHTKELAVALGVELHGAGDQSDVIPVVDIESYIAAY